MAVDSFFRHGDKVFYRGAIKNALHLSSDAERIPSGTRYRLPGHFPSRAILIFHIFLRSHIPAGHNPRKPTAPPFPFPTTPAASRGNVLSA